MPSDKDTSPEQSVAAPTQESTPTPAAPAQADNAALDIAAIQAELQRERDRRIEGERKAGSEAQNYANLRSAYNQRDAELSELRRLRDQLNAGQQDVDTSAQAPAVDPSILSEVTQTRQELAWLRFQNEHPKYREFWDDMQDLAKDPRAQSTIASYRIVGGQPVLDTYAALHNAYNEVLIQRMQKAQVTSPSRGSAAGVDPNKLKAQAAISGNSAASIDEGEKPLTLEELNTMSYDEMIKDPRVRAALPFSQLDPPRGSKR